MKITSELQLKSQNFFFESKQCVTCYLSWPDNIPAHVDSGDVKFQDLVKIGKFRNGKTILNKILGILYVLGQCPWQRREDWEDRRPKKDLTLGQLEGTPGSQCNQDLDDWWVTQRHLEAVSTILPGGRVYYLYYLVIVSTFLPGGSFYYLTWG